MKFSVVAAIFERIAQESSRLTMTQLLADLFGKANPKEAMIISYLSLGILRAPYRGSQFNMAEKSVAKVIADFLQKDVSEITKAAHQTGDLGSVLTAYGDKQDTDKSLLAIYQQLEELEAISGAGSQEEKAQKLFSILESVDALSGQYIVRIVLGKLRLGFSDMTIIDALSWMLVGNKSLHERIEHAYNICADIGLIAYLLKEKGKEGLDEVSIVVGIPIRPAAAERLPTAQDIIDKLGPCVAQPKLDGFRLQVHVDNRKGQKKRWFYSRNLLDMSQMFPDIVKALDDLAVETVIAEGEAIVFDEQTQRFLPFQETVKRKRKHGVEEVAAELPIKLFMFDILYLNGESLLDKAHKTRRQLLLQVFHRNHDVMVSVIEERVLQNAHDLENYFLENIESGLEGLVVKKPEAHYQPGKRNFNWIKFKRQEKGELEDTIDCVVLGYYYGEGKRASFGIGAFLVGVYDKKHDRFETVAKIGTGLKDLEWQELKKKCDAIKIKEQPHDVICAKELVPDVWVVPQIVCIIRADEITRSPLHTAGKTKDELGLALRFPRFMGYRFDKTATEATTVDELKTLFMHQRQR